ncbi:MAG: DnaD domain protein [Clostridia bacterium]|nr:DnaD domain protein [Clostridia bacterium]MBQ3553454.1 DnaD domain protein [Clostridia bacterium]
MIVNQPQDCAGEQYIKVPNVVVDRWIAEGSPVYLAVYLFALRQLEAGNTSITNSQIAEVLHISDVDVMNAFLFYSTKGLVKIHNFVGVDDTDFDIEFCFSQPKGAPVEFRPSYKLSEISRQLTNNPKVSHMYQMVSQMMGKTLSTADTELLYSLYDYYGLPAEVVLVLVEYHVNKGKRSMRAIEKEAAKWASGGIDTVDKARKYIKKREEFLSYAYRVRSIVGVEGRRLTTKELEYINAWQNEFRMDFDMVKAAFELTVNQTGRLSFAYMNKILESWAALDIRKQSEIGKDKKEKPVKKEKKSGYDFAELERRAMQRQMGGGTDGV